MSDQASATPPHEIAENRRKCWGPNCSKTVRLEWCGWRYCVAHYWVYVLRSAENKLDKLRWTRIIR